MIININSSEILAKQIHYIISINIDASFRSTLIPLLDKGFIFSIIKNKNLKQVSYKFVYTTNENRYLALFSNYNLFPKHLQFSYEDVLLEWIL